MGLFELIYHLSYQCLKRGYKKESVEYYIAICSLFKALNIEASIENCCLLPDVLYSVGDGKSAFINFLGNCFGKKWVSVDPAIKKTGENIYPNKIQDLRFKDKFVTLVFIHSHVCLSQALVAFPLCVSITAVIMNCCKQVEKGYTDKIIDIIDPQDYYPSTLVKPTIPLKTFLLRYDTLGEDRNIVKKNKIKKTKKRPSYCMFKILPFHEDWLVDSN